MTPDLSSPQAGLPGMDVGRLDPDRSRRFNVVQPYLLAVIFTVLAVLLRQGLSHYLARPAVIMFIIPILASNYFGGVGPGLLSTVLSTAAVAFFFIPPQYSFYIASFVDRFQVALLLLSGVMISVLRGEFTCTALKGSLRNEESFIRDDLKYKSLFDKMSNGFALHRIVLDDKGSPVDYIFIDVNPVFEDLTGLKRHDIIGKSVTEVFSGDRNDCRAWIKTFGDVALTSTEARFDTKWGNFNKWLSISAYSPLRNYFVAIIEDITEQKEMEETLRQSEEKYRALFQESRDGVFVSTPGGRYIDMNPAGMELFGYTSREEIMALDIERDVYVNPEDRNKFIRLLNDKGFVKDYEIEMKRKDGSKVTVLSTASVVKNNEGKIIAYRGIRRDITQHKKLEQQLVHAQKMEAVGLLAGGVAHDFNNVLTAIIGYASLLDDRSIDGAPHSRREYINEIMNSANKAADITRGLLAFSRKQIINTAPVDINDIIRSAVRLLARLIGEDIEIIAVLSEKPIFCMADHSQLEQVILNLAINARDAMASGGRLIFKAEIVQSAGVHCHQNGKPRDHALITVSDTGVGIKQEDLDNIFEPFYTTKEVGKGTGLGLSMAYGIVKQHDGFIKVASESSKGTDFQIYLPLTKSKQETEKCGVAHIESADGYETVLVVEDDERLRKIQKIVLEKSGYKVILAVDGQDAIEKFAGNKDLIDLVILDMIMPRKNGMEAYREIRKENPSIKVLFTSGYPGDRLDDTFINDDSKHFIRKPVSPNSLLCKVREILDSTGMKAA